MIKKILFSIALSLIPVSVNAETYIYNEMCWYLGKQNHPWIERATCKITDVRNKQGFLDSRTIEARVINSNISYVVKSWFDNRGFMTWDSDRQYSYKNKYSVASPTAGVIQQANLPQGYGITQVTKDLWVRQIPWD
jgi:hypothetical protein